MTTSGSYDYSLTATTIITEAMELIGALAEGETISAGDFATCLRTLNLMVKTLPAEGIGLWKNVEATLFPQLNGLSYSIGPSGDKCTALGYKTEIATAASSAASEIVVDSDDNITDGDVIGIELDDGTVQWSTVDGTPADDTVGLDDSLTDDVAVDNHVYNYTSLIQRPTEIVEARKVLASGYEIPVDIKSRQEYMALSNKTSTGSANMVYYDPILTNGKIYVWPACADVKEYLKFTCRIQIEDFDASTNDPDFPQEWLLPLSYNLAILIAPKFGKQLSQIFIVQAAGMLQSVKGFDMENTSIFISTKKK